MSYNQIPVVSRRFWRKPRVSWLSVEESSRIAEVIAFDTETTPEDVLRILSITTLAPFAQTAILACDDNRMRDFRMQAALERQERDDALAGALRTAQRRR